MKKLWLLVFLIGCSESLITEINPEYQLELNSRLDKVDGYYQLQLTDANHQTIHRISGTLLEDNREPYPPKKVTWESSHYWTIEEGMMFVIRRVIDYRGQWVNVDTLTIDNYVGQTVPTVNKVSYTGTDGEINTMIAPIWDMLGDTMTVVCQFYNSGNPIREQLDIILVD